MSNHAGPHSISLGENSIGFSSYGLPKNLVVFVHGFNGHAIKTWNTFPELIQEHNSFKESDVIFFGYDSLKTQASNMKLRLFNFIDTAVDPTRMEYAIQRDIPSGFAYDKIVIVAHSLGAVITRMAMLYAKAKGSPWLNKCKLVFFAPAHFGSRIPENFKECFQGVTSLFQSFAVTKYPIIKDLAEGSQILTQLERNSRTLLDVGNADYLRAYVVWASNDIVVVNSSFCDDYPEEEIEDTTHTSVCKPTQEKLNALTYVLKCM